MSDGIENEGPTGDQIGNFFVALVFWIGIAIAGWSAYVHETDVIVISGDVRP